ncbi:hypothetical protein F4818DRAFT_453220 [Hypoxylon cercidicola]|nr:hypothetical protein F4818DRAFT_453220 [Hypoxylon cercidicola]
MTTPEVATPQVTLSTLERLPDEVLSLILDFAMTRNSPFLIHRRWMPRPRYTNVTWRHPAKPLKSRPHRRDSHEDHMADWIAINHTCRRIRRLGREAFLGTKVIAMHSTLPARLLPADELRPDRAADWAADYFERVLSREDLKHVRHLALVDANDHAPMWMIALPGLLASFFPQLRSCTLLFGHAESEVEGAAATTGRPARETLRRLLVAVGLRERLVLEESVGRGTSWAENERSMERCIYPILRFKVEALRKKKKEEEEIGTAGGE